MKTLNAVVTTLAVLFLASCAGSRSLPDTFIVFFQGDSVQLVPESGEIVRRAAAAIRTKNPKQIIVAGEPSTVVAPGFKPNLADARFEAVERALIGEGINSDRLSRAAFTESEVRAGATGNRRVEIRLFQTQ